MEVPSCTEIQEGGVSAEVWGVNLPLSPQLGCNSPEQKATHWTGALEYAVQVNVAAENRS